MADQYIVNLVTTAELAALVSGSGLKQGLQYKNTETGVLYVATSANTYERMFLYKTYIAMLSARNIDGNTAQSEDKVLVVGETYVVEELKAGSDFSNVGYVSDGVSFVATNTTPTVWSNDRVYCISDNPIVETILENTLGDIVWDGSNGWYDGILNGAFTQNKTVTPPFGDLTFMPIMVSNTYVPLANYQVVTSDTNGVGLWIVDLTGNGIDIWKACPVNTKIYVEIRVYN